MWQADHTPLDILLLDEKGEPLRKVIASPFVTLDGFIAGPDDTLDWSVGDEVFDREQLPALLPLFFASPEEIFA
jgi:hypothetical protein